MAKLKSLFVAFLTIAASAQKLGINLIRVAILVIFVWIGGLKFWNYEAEGIVPFVANSPFMSFFYTKDAPEYKEYKLKEGELDETKHLWHEENNTYGFSHGLGILIMGIGILTFLGIFSPKTLWVVDPLDGTKEFIKRNGEFTVNIALVENGIPVLGVIYVPVSRTLYFSEDSIGAYRIEGIDARSAGLSPDDLMEKADRLPLEQADTKGFVIVASRSHLSPETEEYIRKLESEYGHVNLISCGSSLKICRVAEGSADIYPRFAPTMEWDTAAGHAIVRASGKNIYLTDERTPLHYNKENLLNPWFIVK